MGQLQARPRSDMAALMDSGKSTDFGSGQPIVTRAQALSAGPVFVVLALARLTRAEAPTEPYVRRAGVALMGRLIRQITLEEKGHRVVERRRGGATSGVRLGSADHRHDASGLRQSRAAGPRPEKGRDGLERPSPSTSISAWCLRLRPSGLNGDLSETHVSQRTGESL